MTNLRSSTSANVPTRCNQFGQAERYIDLLGDQGVHLSEPFTRQLDGKLRELRFSSIANQPESATTSPPGESSSC